MVPGSKACVPTACPSTEYQICKASQDCAAGEVCQPLGQSFQVCALVDASVTDGSASAEGGLDGGGARLDSGEPPSDAASLPDVPDSADGGVDGAGL
jgi:hypothetical protein